MHSIPVINIEAMASGSTGSAIRKIADQIGTACRNFGFFYVVGHGVSRSLQDRLEELSRQFFALDVSEKMQIRMELAGPAWRGFFRVGDELTSGKPDQKEGIYFGAELPDSHPKVEEGIPLHGQNLFPPIEAFRETVLTWMQEMTQLGHTLMRAIALSLGLDGAFFEDRYTDDPLILFRIFHYPPLAGLEKELWSVGEHTDYGLLTILRQDQTGGLQIQSQSKWIDAPIIEDSLICNLGDMLDRMTSGIYRSTPHRVRNSAATGRLSFPVFFDPNWDAVVKPIGHRIAVDQDSFNRWDRANVHDWTGTYGNYILNKVGKVFPGQRKTLETQED